MRTPKIEDEIVLTEVDGVGTIVLSVPVIPKDAPYRVREGIARRRITAKTGKCPCGATANYHDACANGSHLALVLHERLCPADGDRLAKAIRRWQG